jgi:catecholate siderophore receptor
MFQDAEVVGRNFVEVQRWGVAPSLAFRLGSSTQLTLSYWYQAEDNVPDYGLPYLFGEPADVSRKNWYGLASKDYEEINVHIATARFDHAFTDNIRMRDTLRWALYKRDHEVTAPRIVGTPAPGTPLGNILVSRGRPSREREDSIITNLTDFSFKFDTWFLKHTLVTGLELGGESANTTTFTVTGTPTANLEHPNAYQAANLVKVRNQTQETTAFTVGLYAVDEIAITDQWSILGGLRWDRFDADFETARRGRSSIAWTPW